MWSILLTRYPKGEYAIALWHDENNDGKLNKNWLGMPTEGYGFSNNVFGAFGPPDYEECTFKIREGEIRNLDIKLIN